MKNVIGQEFDACGDQPVERRETLRDVTELVVSVTEFVACSVFCFEFYSVLFYCKVCVGVR